MAAGSTYGRLFRITTWGESHGKATGVVVDGCPAGLALTEEDIQKYLDRRKPGLTSLSSGRKEEDKVKILSGVYEGVTTGTPIALEVPNKDHQSRDYASLKDLYRPGHADYTYEMKYGIRDFRGGGRASGRETLGRVAGGAIALKILEEMGIRITAYTRSIGPVTVDIDNLSPEERDQNPLFMPDAGAAARAAAYLEECRREGDSAGGVAECIIRGLPAGLGDPVFDKLSSALGQAILSIGGVKGFEIGDGFAAACSRGSVNNDIFIREEDKIKKKTNHAGGLLGGISDGSDIVFRAAFKPVPSIASAQDTVDRNGVVRQVSVSGRHDPVIVPRAVVVVETMAACVVLDSLLLNMSSKLDRILEFYRK